MVIPACTAEPHFWREYPMGVKTCIKCSVVVDLEPDILKSNRQPHSVGTPSEQDDPYFVAPKRRRPLKKATAY